MQVLSKIILNKLRICKTAGIAGKIVAVILAIPANDVRLSDA